MYPVFYYFDGYFDTRISQKGNKTSYEQIVQIIEKPAEEFLFCLIEAELDVTQVAGMKTCCLVRSGEMDPNASHQPLRKYSAIRL